MLNSKNLLVLSLALLLVMTPVLSLAKGVETSGEIERKYISHRGEVVNVNDSGKSYSIAIQKYDEKGKLTEGLGNQLIVHLTEDVLLLDNKTMDKIEREEIKKGNKVSIHTPANTPMTASIPGQLTPELVVLENDKKDLSPFVKLDEFDNGLLSSDKDLKLNLNEETEIVDLEGNKLTANDVKSSVSVVFYNITTMSIPEQTSPLKVIVLEKGNNIDLTKISLRKMVINGKEVELNNNMIIKGETLMIPLRQTVEELGYEVEWNQETTSINVVKGAQWTSLKVGENQYTFGKMAPFELEEAPELHEDRTFVPVSFLEEVLKLEEVNMNEDNILEIK